MDYSTADMASADAVLERLGADHQRMAEVLDTLQAHAAVLARSAKGEPDAEVVRGLIAALREYVGGGHHVIEEIVFGALARCGVAIEVEASVLELRDDHEQLEARAGRLTSGLEELLAEGQPDAALPARVVDFCQYERHHMKTEADQVFPAVREELAGARWKAVRQALVSRLAETATE